MALLNDELTILDMDSRSSFIHSFTTCVGTGSLSSHVLLGALITNFSVSSVKTGWNTVNGVPGNEGCNETILPHLVSVDCPVSDECSQSFE